MAITPQQLHDLIVHAPPQDAVFAVGEPGSAKSAMFRLAAKTMGMLYMGIYCATCDAIDSRGVPIVIVKPDGTHRMDWAPPERLLPLAMDASRFNGGWVLTTFDDFAHAPLPTLRAFARSIYGDGAERCLGAHPIYDKLRIGGTSNRETDRAGANRFETYISNRVCLVEVKPDVEGWVKWALAESDIPEDLIAFVQSNGQVSDFSPEKRSFMSPRSLEQLGRFVKSLDKANIDGDILQEVATGTIGEEQAVKYLAFRKLRDKLPDIDAILRSEDAPLPMETSILYITAMSIIRKAKEQHCGAVAKLLNRLAAVTDGNTEVKTGIEVSGFLFQECVRGAAKALRGITQLGKYPEVLKWLRENNKYYVEYDK